jgi:hypothetical protein
MMDCIVQKTQEDANAYKATLVEKDPDSVWANEPLVEPTRTLEIFAQLIGEIGIPKEPATQ